MVRTARALRSARTLGTTGVPAAFACLASLALLATTLSACGRGNLASHLTPTPDLARASNQARCGVAKSHDRPLIIEWPSAERAALESAVRRDDHLIVVRYSGCDMEVLRHCRAQGRYTFASVQRKDDNSYLRSADELYAKIPLGAAHLEAELERHGALHLAMTYIGAYEADPTGISEALDVSKLKGRCEGATHVVTNLNVGAFVLSSAAGAEIQAGAELGPPASLGRGPRGG
ncbi:MAG TPA: hypothetical protein ENK31_07660, partial [Nannocystis exedens]|nr:hypothetical protein [Nannocystis exedens]